jgi:capsular polysaccharide biosynthesis protein
VANGESKRRRVEIRARRRRAYTGPGNTERSDAKAEAFHPRPRTADQSSVSEESDTNLLVFNVTDRSAARAAELATTYARQFSRYVRERDTDAIAQALEKVEKRISGLDSADRRSSLYATLVGKEQQLETALTLQAAAASVVRTAATATRVEPRPMRDGALGLFVGLAIGLGLAYARDAFESRVRTADEIVELLGIPLLGRVPKPPRRLRRKKRLVMAAAPHGPYAEPFRMVRAAVDRANRDHDIRTILVTSSIDEEGKSTTAANLAVSLSRAGRSVVLIDLDLPRHRRLTPRPEPCCESGTP